VLFGVGDWPPKGRTSVRTIEVFGGQGEGRFRRSLQGLDSGTDVGGLLRLRRAALPRGGGSTFWPQLVKRKRFVGAERGQSLGGFGFKNGIYGLLRRGSLRV